MALRHRLITFSGQMGAGKTTFIAALCRALGVDDTVSSPTFALINEYGFHGRDGEETIYHIDLYRLRNEEEAVQAGMEDCFGQAMEGRAYCMVEWPERAGSLLDVARLEVSIEITGETTRALTARPVSR